ncbi:MAG: hypothetical protein Q8S33_17390 [Myxococcales bacterium]|nr:hypothetical protein [Myxococcales bacterium]MDP3502115.1 hypothetical protein [Myxococcales bacterium]
MTDPAPKPAAARVATVVWALVVVAVLACTATGVVTLFGSKIGPAFPRSADALSGDEPSTPPGSASRRTVHDFATDAGEP